MHSHFVLADGFRLPAVRIVGTDPILLLVKVAVVGSVGGGLLLLLLTFSGLELLLIAHSQLTQL
jgi:hypothetical protein